MPQPESKNPRNGLRIVDPDEMDRCGAETSSGSPCSRKTDEDRCWQHRDRPVAGPPPPSHMGEHGKQEWNRQVRDIAKAGALDSVDMALLEQACEIYQARRLSHDAIVKHGIVVESPRGGVKKNPAAAKMKSYATEFRLCIRELREMVEEARQPDEDHDDPLADW